MYLITTPDGDEDPIRMMINITPDGAVVPGMNMTLGPLPLRYSWIPPGGELVATKQVVIDPEDPRYVFAVQEAMPDGVMVAGARVDGVDISWGGMIERFRVDEEPS